MRREKILFARVDKIGDLILTLPMEQAWLGLHPQDEVHWLVEKNLKFVMNALPAKPRVFYVERAKGLLTQIQELIKLVEFLKKENFQTAFGIHVPWWIALAFWWVRIPVRVGVASQWFSWIFYNKKVRQGRSQAIKNEGEYNLDLIRSIEKSSVKFIPAKLISPSEKREQWKARMGEGFTVIHPGMAGSARNWPLSKYRELAESLIKKGSRVVVTGSALDRGMIEASGILNVNGVENYVEKTPPEDLLCILSLAGAVVAPSTGVAHLAASLGKKVIGIYSPVRVQKPLRWGAQGKGVRLFVPEVECPGTFKCLEGACAQYDCMTKIEVDTIAKTVMEQSND